jgi:altronate hydrolase
MNLVKLPHAGNSALLLHPADNVAIARVPLTPGLALRVGGREVTVREPIAAGHKIAVSPIAEGGVVRRYGEAMGRARQAIEPGRHVHTQNVAFEELTLDYEFPREELPLPAPAREPVFLGYPREDGRVGTRNYIAVAAASNCSAHTVELVARSFENEKMPPNVDGVAGFPYGDGCAHAIGPDTEQLRRTILGVLNHPNVSGAVLIGLGCETNQVSAYPEHPKLIRLTLQESGGTSATVEEARRQIRRLIEAASAERRVETPASRIVLGLNCGGSDSFSGVTANPALGVCSDRLAAIGATAVLAETTEIFGAEHLLVRRSRNRAVAGKLLAAIRWYKEYLTRFGESFDDNVSPGNKAGGLTNILEKSLGAVAKGGTSPLMDVVDFAGRVTTPGLVFMNTPGYDPVSLTGLAAGGVNLIAFTTGRGSAIGFPSIPVIKIATNSATWSRMRENMDVNAGAIADGERTVEEVGNEIFERVLRAASGERTAAERLGHNEFVPWRIGPVL